MTARIYHSHIQNSRSAWGIIPSVSALDVGRQGKCISPNGGFTSFPCVPSPSASAGDRFLHFTQQDTYGLMVLTPLFNAFPLQLMWKVRSLDLPSRGRSGRLCLHVLLVDYVTTVHAETLDHDQPTLLLNLLCLHTMTAKVTLTLTCWSSVLRRYFRSNSVQISVIAWVKYSKQRADNREGGGGWGDLGGKRSKENLETAAKRRQKGDGGWGKMQSVNIWRKEKLGIFPSPLPEAMGELFFLISITSLHSA